MLVECETGGVHVTRHPAPPRQGTQLVFLAANSLAELEQFGLAAEYAPSAAIWVVSYKGRRLTLRDVEVMSFAQACGYVSTKVVSYDEDRTALRFVRRKAERSEPSASKSSA